MIVFFFWKVRLFFVVCVKSMVENSMFSNSCQRKILRWCFMPPELLPVIWVLKSNLSVASSCCSLLTRNLTFKEQRSYWQINFHFQVYLGLTTFISFLRVLGLFGFQGNLFTMTFPRELRCFPILDLWPLAFSSLEKASLAVEGNKITILYFIICWVAFKVPTHMSAHSILQ